MRAERVLRLIFAPVLLTSLAAAPALADFKLEREFPLAAGGRFALDSSMGSVEVRGTKGSTVRVVITSTRDDIEDYMRFGFDASADRVEVRGEKLRTLSGMFSWFGGARLKYKVELPAGVEVRVATAGGSIEVVGIDAAIDLDTSGGSVVARSIGGPVTIDTSGGSIEIEDVRADAEISTSGGSIEARSVAGSLDAETSGGSITLEGIGGRVRAETSGGTITAALAPGNDAGGELSTSGGSIRVSLPAGARLSVDAHCSGGRVRSELPIAVSGTQSRETLRGDLNGGGAELRLRTSGGSITIE